mmetsp:Transcript_35904/g.115407  ORF Transcript_35904/g.115407 Transcript_35904/m.115407 type:complete len:211 (+) Transcript_35904:85-717(+)
MGEGGGGGGRQYLSHSAHSALCGSPVRSLLFRASVRCSCSAVAARGQPGAGAPGRAGKGRKRTIPGWRWGRADSLAPLIVLSHMQACGTCIMLWSPALCVPQAYRQICIDWSVVLRRPSNDATMMSAPTLLLSSELKLSFAQWNEELVNVLIGHIGDCGWIPSRTLVLVHQRSTDPLKKVGRLQHEALTRSELGAQAGVKGKTLGFAEEA